MAKSNLNRNNKKTNKKKEKISKNSNRNRRMSSNMIARDNKTRNLKEFLSYS